MKVVCCKNCGARYQLDDDDDVSTFECSSCAGDLELDSNYSKEINENNSQIIDTYRYDNSYIVQCRDCGLKYRIQNNENILDYECDSCGGPLRYLDSEMNKELDKQIKERNEQIKNFTMQHPEINTEEINEEKPPETANTLKTFTDKLENFFSEDRMLEIADEEKQMQIEEEIREDENKTARTTIPQNVMTKFGREFALPRSNDYNVMKDYLRDEFRKGMEEYYPQQEEKTSFKERFSIKEPEIGILTTPDEMGNNEDDFDITNMDLNQTIMLVGGIILAISIFEILTVNSGMGIMTLFIGVIMLCFSLYKSMDTGENEEKTKIIRERLLTLPQEYYVFYNVKTPTSKRGINHVVVGPTGIYAILSKKLSSKNKVNPDKDNIKIISSYESDKYSLEEVPEKGSKRKFRYTTKQAKFSQDNEIKQKALTLGEDLINFLNENNIPNCFVEPLIGFINDDVVVINMPLTDEDLFIEELINKIQTGTVKLENDTIDKCAVLINKISADCSTDF